MKVTKAIIESLARAAQEGRVNYSQAPPLPVAQMGNESQTTLWITLPWPPTANTIWRHVGQKVLLSAEGREYRKQVALTIAASRCLPFGDARLEVVIFLKAPDRRRYDIDNRNKAALDAMQAAGLFNNDAQIDKLTTVRCEPTCTGEGSALVCIRRKS